MKILKNAFTLPELLIFITIVGVISVLMITVIKPDEKYLPYAYYNAYNALSTAAYNIKEDANDLSLSTDTGSSEPDADKIFPGANQDADPKAAAKELCKKLAVNPESNNDYGYINTTEYNCNNLKTVPLMTFNPDDITPNMAFRATNSMRYFISEMGTKNVYDSLTKKSVKLKYFVVWVDLNGDRRPNIIAWSNKKAPDIVPFIITTSGTVLPAGGPTIDRRYTSVRLQYPTDASLSFSAGSMTYREGQIKAYYGNQYPTYDLNSIETSTFLKNSKEFINAWSNIESFTQPDNRCKIDSDEIPSCTILVDENKKL